MGGVSTRNSSKVTKKALNFLGNYPPPVQMIRGDKIVSKKWQGFIEQLVKNHLNILPQNTQNHNKHEVTETYQKLNLDIYWS